MKKILMFITLALALGACSKDDNDPETSGDTVLSSQIMGSDTNYYVEGFSFEEAKKVNYSITSSTFPDLVAENRIDLSGAVIGANIISPQNEAGFYKAGEFSSLAEAETFYNNITDAGTNTYTVTAEDVKAYQVYIFQTRGKKYAKFLIKDFTIVPSPLLNYTRFTIEWSYQPSGEKNFASSN